MGKVISAHSSEVSVCFPVDLVEEHSSMETVSSRKAKETKKGQGLLIPFLSPVTTRPAKLHPIVPPPSRDKPRIKL